MLVQYVEGRSTNYTDGVILSKGLTRQTVREASMVLLVICSSANVPRVPFYKSEIRLWPFGIMNTDARGHSRAKTSAALHAQFVFRCCEPLLNLESAPTRCIVVQKCISSSVFITLAPCGCIVYRRRSAWKVGLLAHLALTFVDGFTFRLCKRYSFCPFGCRTLLSTCISSFISRFLWA